MGKEKKYFYTWEDKEEGKKSVHTMAEEILADEDLPGLDKLIIGCWGEPYEEDCQPILDAIAANPEKFAHIRSLFFGDMDYEECEVSWIMQGNYEKLWDALPNLRELVIKGSSGLCLGNIRHERLERLEIICGGLPSAVMDSIQKAKLPALTALNLYLGSSDYGFDGTEETVRQLLEQSDFPKLKSLGICDSEMQDEVAGIVLDSKYAAQLEALDLSRGTLGDVGGKAVWEALPRLTGLSSLNLHFHYLSDEWVHKIRQKCKELSIEADLDGQQEEEEYEGERFRYAMLTE